MTIIAELAPLWGAGVLAVAGWQWAKYLKRRAHAAKITAAE